MALRRTLLCSVTGALLLTTAPAAAAATQAAQATTPGQTITQNQTAAQSQVAAQSRTASRSRVAAVAPAAATTGFQAVDIVADDGAVLKANVIAPSTAGRHPAIVFISSWALNDAEYLAQASTLAQAGYVVLSYTARGFWSSGGRIETAGPADVADVSTALDWVVGHTAADPARLGVAGVSYGAGIGLLAAGHDTRVRAVAALSGWTDLVESLYGNETRRPQAVWLLQASARLFGRPSAEFDQMVADYFANRNIAGVKAWGRLRSPATYLAAVNASAPAVLLANAYGDSLFPPNQLVDFFGRLAGPKRLELAAGDHAVVEATGLLGLPNHVWTSVRRWFDQYLAGQDTGIAGEPPVVLRVRNSDAVESYPDWAHVSRSVARYGLGAVRWWDGTGPLAGAPSTGWSQTIQSDVDTVADGGVALLSNGLEALTGIPPLAWLPAVDRRYGAVWLGDTLSSAAAVRGIGRLHLTVRPSASTGTVVGYLYDVDALGTGRLVVNTPVSWSGVTPDAPLTLDVALPATAWNVPAGHRLALVVDTRDPLYLDENPDGASVTMTGPSWLDLPLR